MILKGDQAWGGLFSLKEDETYRRYSVVVDHAGKQVLSAGRFLSSKEYSEVKRLNGGLIAWSQKGCTLER